MSGLFLPAGTYWISIANDTNGDDDSWVWGAASGEPAPASFSQLTQTSGYQDPPFEWQLMFAVNGTPGPPGSVATPFAVTGIQYDSVSHIVTLSWNSSKGQTFQVFFDTDLEGAPTLIPGTVDADSVLSETTHSFTIPNPGARRMFFTVVKDS